jgi:hypothetical protein
LTHNQIVVFLQRHGARGRGLVYGVFMTEIVGQVHRDRIRIGLSESLKVVVHVRHRVRIVLSALLIEPGVGGDQ